MCVCVCVCVWEGGGGEKGEVGKEMVLECCQRHQSAWLSGICIGFV